MAKKLKVKFMLAKEQSTKSGGTTLVPPLTDWAICESEPGYDRPVLWISNNIPNPQGIGNGIIAALDKAGIKLITE